MPKKSTTRFVPTDQTEANETIEAMEHDGWELSQALFVPADAGSTIAGVLLVFQKDAAPPRASMGFR